jgi:hypothetical protein
MGPEWPFWTLSGLLWVWSVSLSGHAGAMICPLRDQKGSSDAGPDRYLEHPPATVLERAEELSEQGGAAVVAPVASPTRPGAARRAEGKGELGSRARMEREGKNSASFRVSRAVGVQKVRAREPLQEAAPGGRPGRLGDAVEAGAPVGPREASCFPGKLLF